MSTSLAHALPRRPPLHPLPELPTLPPSVSIAPDRAQRRARPRAVYAAVIATGFGAILVSQLLLSIALSDGAYFLDSLTATRAENARTEQLLVEDLGRLSSPQNLARNAEALGMVQNANPVWLRTSNGQVIGVPSAAQGTAGQVLGSAGSKVANQLLTGVPLVTQLTTGSAATPSAPAPAATVGPVALPGELTSPVTR